MRGDIRPAICRIKRMNSASKCLIQHFEALIAIFIADISSESGGNNHNDMLQFLWRGKMNHDFCRLFLFIEKMRC